MEGWIKIYRSIRDHWIWSDPVKFQWWIDILMEVNHQDRKINIGMQIIECKRGQSIISLQNWALRWNVNKSKVRRFFELLEKDTMIRTENVKKTTRLTVCNYELYQVKRNDNETQAKRKRNASEPKQEREELKEDILQVKILEFKKECETFINGEFSKQMVTDFYIYWSEPNKPKTKMLCEFQKTWDTKRRLHTWKNNQSKWNK